MTFAFQVDGMTLDVPVPIPGARAASTGPVDWTVTLEHVREVTIPTDVDWTGDARDASGIWGRFGRRGADERVVALEFAELRAFPRERAAVIRHAYGPAWDAGALRRLAPYLAALAGRTALHAAAVALPAGAVLLCGPSGAGKSTLALAMDRAGIPVLGDDHVVAAASDDGRVRAFPSFPFVDVCEASLASLGESDDAETDRKVRSPFQTPRPLDPTPIAALAFLERGTGLTSMPMRAPEALARLLQEAVFVADPADGEAQVARLDTCVALLAAVPAVRLMIPDDLSCLAATAAAVAALWSGRGR